ncbi:MAG: hypothetical protein COW76_01670 [Shewanella sp. CG18_big_fil_WC_8_21_14_2_50_42_11]|uniref:hypothetical protein n=1 Tax=Shewanella sp. CG18_big_fil_WC_8_21_14_2_50_42_11 TaxID=1975538 RepID=UPI000C5E2B87|nr:hypothetical protein [Shewanella sp. CG18_big_fil_WC_8_21_14_2_50_42_11]PIQ02149.1 MAG: hypothetical protein COW76_01670 [Shewanella sp. CG18_big_fil_WC_8_21_14_2_50_42_11]
MLEIKKQIVFKKDLKLNPKRVNKKASQIRRRFLELVKIDKADKELGEEEEEKLTETLVR